jgi:hypothetical protein
MREELEKEIFSKLKQERNVKNNTAKVYIGTLNTLAKKMGITEDYKSLHWIKKNPRGVINTIEESNYTDSTRKRFYTTLMSVLPLVSEEKDKLKIPGFKKFLSMFEQKLKIRDEKTKNQKMSEKEEEGWLSETEIKTVSDILLKTRNLADYIMWTLLTKIPPRRGLDYNKMVVTTNDIKNPKRNYAIRNKDNFQGFVFYNFKNAQGEPQVFNRKFFTDNFDKDGNDFVQIMDRYLKMKKDGDPFLLKDYTQSAFSRYIVNLSKPLTGKHTNGNIFRHMYISRFMKRSPFQKEREIVARYMSHTLREQSNYRKRNKEEEKELDIQEEKYNEIPGIDIPNVEESESEDEEK